MTKFILVGGYPHKALDGGRAFVDELTKGFAEPVKILECLFARPREDWEKAFAQDREFFAKHLAGKKYEIVLADPEKFIEQLKWADTTYIRGGSNGMLRNALDAQTGWIEAVEGKTVAGSSAGANNLSKYYYGLDEVKLAEGIGLVPVKILVHYKSDYNAPNIDWDKAYEELENFGEDLPILTLAEGQFEVWKN